MPDFPPDGAQLRSSGELNEAQQRRLLITCGYIDKLLSDVEQILHETASKSPFPRHIVDITPAQTRVIEDHIQRLREQLLRTLAWQQMKPDPPDIPAKRAILTTLTFIDIAIEELKPSYMRGSGRVPEKAARELNGVVHELRSIVQGTERYIRQEFGSNLQSRLEKLEVAGHDVSLLRTIEEIVTRHGLVEFRARIASLAARLEDNHLEVALFGRVSSGKSSLLNALLGTNVLPIGVNPITAVPTRLRYGPSLQAAVTFASGSEEIVSIEEFADLVSEHGNPGNQRNVVRALVEVPSSRLKHGIVLVDTPGLGSLAKRGAAETMAYLPSCDLALLLIDSGNALSDEDVGTLRILLESGIPALVLLSKADLLAEGDLHRATSYIEEQLRTELNISLHVHPVSSLPRFGVVLDHFFERELLPRFEQARVLREASVARKIGALRDAVIAALETLIDRGRRKSESPAEPDAESLEARLRHVSGVVGEQRTFLNQAFLELGERPQSILMELADKALTHIGSGIVERITAIDLSEWTHELVQDHVDQALSKTRATVRDAIEILRSAAEEMGRSDKPAYEDAEALLRDVPRFEIDVIPCSITVGRWKWLGRWPVRTLVKNGLRSNLLPTLRFELHNYGRALSQWTDQMTRKMMALVNSYTDAYRAQLNRVHGTSLEAVQLPELTADLERLRSPIVTSADLEERRA